MKICTIILLCLFCVGLTHDQDDVFILFDEITLPAPASLGQKLTMDGKVLFVSTTDPSVEMFRRNGDTFVHVQSLEDPEDIIEDVECTPDQKWLAVACWDGAVYIYKWEGSTYELFQHLQNEEDVKAFAVTFSDDHELLIMGSTTRVTVYTFDGSKFVSSQNITEPKLQDVYEVILSRDKSSLIVADHSRYVSIFRRNGSEYALLEQISFAEEDYRLASLSGDEQTLVVSSTNSKEVTVFAQKDNSFEKKSSFKTSNPVWQPCLSHDGEWLAVTSKGEALVYKQEGNRYELEEKFIHGTGQISYWHYVHSGHDGRHAIVVVNNKIYVYSTESICDTSEFITDLECPGTKAILIIGILLAVALVVGVVIVVIKKRREKNHERDYRIQELDAVSSKSSKVETAISGQKL